MDFLEQIKRNNATHVVDKEELKELVFQANKIFKENHSNDVWFERSVFINWTCGIADCKYCYLSTVPKLKKDAVRSMTSILAEALICREMEWKIGYITGGLRVETNEYLIDLVENIQKITKYQIMMNFGPYHENIIKKFKPHVVGMGSAIESFDEELHNFICPSKPLKSLMKFLEDLKNNHMQKLITIILGLGDKKEHVDIVIENIKKYNIEKIQLCFLKPQENTLFSEVPSPHPEYMAWWIARIRIACPEVIIKIALVRDRIEDLSLYLNAGANCFSRFMVFDDFNTSYAKQLEQECKKAGRNLLGNFTSLPELNVEQLVSDLPFENDMKKQILPKTKQYYEKLKKKMKNPLTVIKM